MNLYILASAVIFFILFYGLVQDSFIKRAVMLFSGILFATVQFLVVNITADRMALIFNGEGGIYTTGAVFCYAVSTLILLPLVLWFMKTVMRNYLIYVDGRQIRNEMVVMLLLSLAWLLLTVAYQTADSGDLESYRSTFYPMLFTTFMLLFSYGLIIRLSLARALAEETRKSLAVLQENARSLNREIARSRENAHDLRHIIRQIYTLLGDEHITALDAYMERVLALTEHTEKVFCENVCINALFQYYCGVCVRNGIHFEAAVSCGELAIPDADLTILLGNALENAVTACVEYRQKTDLEAVLTVSARVIADDLTVQIENSCAEVVLTDGADPQEKARSAAAFRSVHPGGGQGLKRMEFVAESRNGKVDFTWLANEERFVTRIFLPQH